MGNQKSSLVARIYVPGSPPPLGSLIAQERLVEGANVVQWASVIHEQSLFVVFKGTDNARR